MGWFKKKQEMSREEMIKALSEMKKPKMEKKETKMKSEENPTHPYQHNLERPVKLDEYDYVKRLRGIRKWKHKIVSYFKPDKGILANMELVIGDHITFVAWEKDGGFKYRGGKYLFDHESKYYNASVGMWCYDYHEKFSLPIKRKFPYREMRDVIKMEVPDVELATNPDSLEEFINAKIIEGIMKGAGLEEFLRRLFFVSLVTLIILIGFVIMFAAKTGMFDKIKIPGLS